MRFAWISSFALLSFALSFAAHSEDSAPSLPTRKAGLWELKTVMDEGNGPRDQTLKICIDDRMERNTVSASVADHKANCSKYDVKAENGTTVTDAECIYNQRFVVSKTTMSGDFAKTFEIKIASTTSDPNAKEQSVVIKRTITQTGSYVGESCGDLKGGEAMGADGSKIAVQ